MTMTEEDIKRVMGDESNDSRREKARMEAMRKKEQQEKLMRAAKVLREYWEDME